MDAYKVDIVLMAIVMVIVYCASLYAAVREKVQHRDAAHQLVFIGNELRSSPQRRGFR